MLLSSELLSTAAREDLFSNVVLRWTPIQIIIRHLHVHWGVILNLFGTWYLGFDYIVDSVQPRRRDQLLIF